MAVIGAGLTGGSWAGLYAAAGLEVRLHDVDGARLEAAVERAAAAAGFLAGSGLADMQTAERGVELLTGTADLAAAVAGVTHVQECVREDLDAQARGVRGRRAPRRRPTRSSARARPASPSATSRRRRRGPERCLAAHPYNPPHLVPLVELAPGALTSPEAMDRAAAFYASVGKEPVKLTRDLPGYLANRLSAALWREAVDLVLRGVATVEDVDKAVSCGPGLRWAAMGPHLLYDLGGGEDGIVGHVEHLAGGQGGHAARPRDVDDVPARDRRGAATPASPDEKGARSYDELVAERDALLVAYLRARREQRGRLTRARGRAARVLAHAMVGQHGGRELRSVDGFARASPGSVRVPVTRRSAGSAAAQGGRAR